MAVVTPIDLETYTKYLPTQYSDSPLLHKLLGVYLAQVQQLEDANMELNRVSTSIPLAGGYQLDIIAKLVGVTRNGRTDEQTREAIYAKISLNIGNGCPEDVIQYLASVTQAEKVGYWEHAPASVVLEVTGGTIVPEIGSLVSNVTAAGVSVGGILSSETGEVFRGVESSLVFSNGVFPTEGVAEYGDSVTEMGNELSEFSSSLSISFQEVDDSVYLSRGILPEYGGVAFSEGKKYFGFKGNAFAGGFGTVTNTTSGKSFISLSKLQEETDTTQGIFADIY